MSIEWLEIAKRLEAIAQTGLSFTDNVYDVERYEEIREISHKIFNTYTDEPIEKIYKLFTGEEFYPTPKVDIRGVVFRGNRILMVKEKLDGHWSLPGGWADIGYTPKEVVVKEVEEESGLLVEPERILALMDKKCHNHPPSPFHVYKVFILCKEIGGTLVTGIETSDTGFFSKEELPDLSLERITPDQIFALFDLVESNQLIPLLD